MVLHDLLHQSGDNPEPKPTVTRNPAEPNTGNETDLKAQTNDQQRQIEELVGVRRDLREKVANLESELKDQRSKREAAERRLNAAAAEVQRLYAGEDAAALETLQVNYRTYVERCQSLELQVREAQATARARDEDYRRERRRAEKAEAEVEALHTGFTEAVEKIATKGELKTFEVTLCPEVPTTPEEKIVQTFEAHDVAVAKGVGHLFFYRDGQLIGGAAHNEWKTLREMPSDGDRTEADV